MTRESANCVPEAKWKPGDEIITDRRTVDASTIARFAALAGNYDQIHTDSVFMASSRFGQRIAHGSLTYALASGLLAAVGYRTDSHDEVTNLRTTKPVYAGDTLHVVGSVRAVSDPGGRVTSAAFSVKNQHGEDVLTFSHGKPRMEVTPYPY